MLLLAARNACMDRNVTPAEMETLEEVNWGQRLTVTCRYEPFKDARLCRIIKGIEVKRERKRSKD